MYLDFNEADRLSDTTHSSRACICMWNHLIQNIIKVLLHVVHFRWFLSRTISHLIRIPFYSKPLCEDHVRNWSKIHYDGFIKSDNEHGHALALKYYLHLSLQWLVTAQVPKTTTAAVNSSNSNKMPFSVLKSFWDMLSNGRFARILFIV